MPADNPFLAVVTGYVELFQAGLELQPPPVDRQPATPVPDTVLLFSPHPDDECLTAGLPLRLLRQTGMQVVNVAVTLGSLEARRAERRAELEQACAQLGFNVLVAGQTGLERIDPLARRRDRRHWAAAVDIVAEIIATQRPKLILLPHARDWHSTHCGTHYLVRDAVARQDARFACWTIETEYWAPMTAPDLLIESSPSDVATMMAGLACHHGEVARNPYHLRLPAWLIDNVRRGAELLLGRGAVAPEMMFATLYRRRRWANGRWLSACDRPAISRCGDEPAALFRLLDNDG